MGALKSQVFTTPGPVTFSVPSTVSFVWANIIGASTGTLGAYNDAGPGGGGAAESAFGVPIPCTPGGTITGTIGAGGVKGSWDDVITTPPHSINQLVLPTPGGDTTFGPIKACGSQPLSTASLWLSQASCDGGGPTGQAGSTGFTYFAITPIKKASLFHFGGSTGGGGGPGINTIGYDGAGSSGALTGGTGGGTGGAGYGGGGGAGAASPFGRGGGDGGAAALLTFKGGPGVQATAAGAGSGSGANGSFSVAFTSQGTSGADGRIEVFWFE